ncbi:Alpha-1 3/1 6-mannosyltransferase alg-2 [Ceratocystis lukuohia]|uniref:Alpha-1,3/1,6-mannosyltransferase ALG2 n=2 Tax=Ceratocystis TaxID=5157 RepID=A0A0F8BVC8_CERFI|nr:Alpha-1 3/1 6-mannosyltransferase alg-2 [Ceratocystis platani]
MAPPKPKTFVFFHPDLGIGGAERLVVDAAVGLQNKGHKVVIFTSHCDPSHCFEEARDGTLDVRVRGNLFPASIFARLTILFSILRQLHLILQIYLNGELAALNPDIFIVDQLSAGLPMLQYLFPKQGILFYCHFPDMLLARGREKLIKRLYRLPFDWVEQWSTSYAHAIAVNSEFTKSMVAKTMPGLAQRDLRVVYPAIETESDRQKTTKAAKKSTEKKTAKNSTREEPVVEWLDEKVILSINRFERKKDISLAIRAFAAVPETKRAGVRLVIAGGYDPRVAENVEYHTELDELAASLGLTTFTAKTTVTALAAPASASVLFLLSVPTALKTALLNAAHLLVYTPSHEHFGIVPLEAMGAGVPVLACNNGGPVETVLDGATGWLRDPLQLKAWSEVMAEVLGDEPATLHRLALMRETGRKRVQNFSVEQLGERLDRISQDIEDTPRQRPLLTSFLNLLSIFVAFAFGLAISKILSP